MATTVDCAPAIRDPTATKILREPSQKHTDFDPVNKTKPERKSGKSKDKVKARKKRGDDVKKGEKLENHEPKAPNGTNLAKIAELVQMLGYSKEDVSEATERLKETGDDLTCDSLIEMSSIVQNASLERSVTEKCHISGRGKEEPVDNNPEDSGECEENMEEPSGKSEEMVYKEQLRKAIERRKMELRSAIEAMTFQCRVCNCSRATILLLPCGHLASCDDCLMDVRRCPINRCNKVVRGTKDVYFV